MSATPNMGAIEAAYRARTPGSAKLAARARDVLPSGVVHDSRYILPYGLYAERGQGAHKWDVDGNRFIDYFGGHGALLLGHNPPAVMDAVAAQLARGTHFAAGSDHEVAWAERICAMVPSAQCVRFHASGTEASLMAVRLARAFTGRNKLLRFRAHYHGWQDDMTSGFRSHFDGTPPIGVSPGAAHDTLAIEREDVDELERIFAQDNDLAAVFLEPLGASTGKVPVDRAFLARLRELTAKHGVILIFDEVITGFRAAPGGVQAATGITPDLTTLAKIVAGGLPGGAVAGRRDILDGLNFDAAARGRREKIYHPGTFNACPVSAVAGIAALDIIRDTDACECASNLAGVLRDGLNDVLRACDIPWAVYGESSAFHIFMQDPASSHEHTTFDPLHLSRETLLSQPPGVSRLLRLALNNHGVDFSGWPGGLVSSVHTPDDITATVEAFDASLRDLVHDGLL